MTWWLGRIVEVLGGYAVLLTLVYGLVVVTFRVLDYVNKWLRVQKLWLAFLKENWTKQD